jgi:Ni2+-binding GTPase involved in maturation of urease and hydrogenase
LYRYTPARAMTYSDLMVLTKQDLVKILADFPEERKRLRNRAVRTIVRDHVVGPPYKAESS